MLQKMMRLVPVCGLVFAICLAGCGEDSENPVEPESTVPDTHFVGEVKKPQVEEPEKPQGKAQFSGEGLIKVGSQSETWRLLFKPEDLLLKSFKIRNNGDADFGGRIECTDEWMTVLTDSFFLRPGDECEVVIMLVQRIDYETSGSITVTGDAVGLPATVEVLVEDRWRGKARRFAAAMDSTNPTTRDFAASIAAKSPGPYNIGQICFIYDHLYKSWRYVSDPRGLEYVSPASRTIQANLVGDCDDFAVLMASVIEAVGGAGRVILAYSQSSAHAYAEVYMGSTENTEDIVLKSLNDHYKGFWDWLLGVSPIKEVNFHVDANGWHWMNLDWGLEHPGGPFFDATMEVAVYPDGRYEILK